MADSVLAPITPHMSSGIYCLSGLLPFLGDGTRGLILSRASVVAVHLPCPERSIQTKFKRVWLGIKTSCNLKGVVGLGRETVLVPLAEGSLFYVCAPLIWNSLSQEKHSNDNENS